MRILVVSATEPEIAQLLPKPAGSSEKDLRLRTCAHASHEIHELTTGVGMVATAAWCSRVLSQNHYDLALNFGICGSFDPAIAIGQVVHVISDCVAELGAEDGDGFLTMQELGLVDAHEFPFKNGRLVNFHPPASATLDVLVPVNGITVNTVHGKLDSIAAIGRRLKPQVESMEGAGFMYACMIHEVPFAQVRAVSNIIERRNRAAWNVPAAIGNLTKVAQSILEEI